MAGRNFTRFHLDVGLGDVFLAPAERLQGRDWLGFAGIEAPRLSAISREQQFAEKLHAYTLPRPDDVINTRVKDLVDMLLLRQDPGLDPARLRQAIQATFARRHTHSPPSRWSEPPTTWAGPFSALARQCGLALTLAEAFHQLAAGLTGLDPGFPPSSTGPG